MSFNSLNSIADFLIPVNRSAISEGIYQQSQIGSNISVYEHHLPDIQKADLILISCSEVRGCENNEIIPDNANVIRREFYNLYNWHSQLHLVDLGNIKIGAALEDTYAALHTVLHELYQQNKKVVIIGGSHDLTLCQYNTYVTEERIIEATCVDALINIDIESDFAADNFLMPMFIKQPNFLKHYNHIGFQSYLVNAGILETIDKFGFDCYRVGKVKENIEEMEPVIRNSHFLSFDIAAIQSSHAPANHITPNGFTGEEACTLMQYAGLGARLSSVGIYSYSKANDISDLTAKQISYMIWYLIDGIVKANAEADLKDKANFNEYHLAFADMENVFLQSKKTGRWWMQLPHSGYLPCSYNDYIIASRNEIPERWLRAVERS